LGDAAFTWRPRNLSFWTVLSYIEKKKIVIMFEFLEIYAFVANSVTDVSLGFWPPFCCPSEWAATWRLHTNLYKFGEKSYLRKSCIRNIAVTWILARFFAELPSFFSQILDLIYWIVLIFILIYFKRRDTENQQFQAGWQGLPLRSISLKK